MEGKKIKEFCVAEGISLTELAKRMNISQPALSSLLASDNIKTGTLEAVASATGKSPAFFYAGEHAGIVGVVRGNQVIGRQDGPTAALEKQLEVKDQQIDRLLGIIEKK